MLSFQSRTIDSPSDCNSGDSTRHDPSTDSLKGRHISQESRRGWFRYGEVSMAGCRHAAVTVMVAQEKLASFGGDSERNPPRPFRRGSPTKKVSPARFPHMHSSTTTRHKQTAPSGTGDVFQARTKALVKGTIASPLCRVYRAPTPRRAVRASALFRRRNHASSHTYKRNSRS